jgi:hypothetical protein
VLGRLGKQAEGEVHRNGSNGRRRCSAGARKKKGEAVLESARLGEAVTGHD